MTLSKVVFRPAAEADLTEIYQYITDRSGRPQTAIGYIRRIRTYCETLASFPERGRRRDDLRRGLRVVGFERRVVIAYMVLDTGEVEIGRIFYGGRNYEALLQEEDEE